MQNWVKVVLIMVAIILISLAVFFGPGCGVSRSPLVKDKTVPLICRLAAECWYSCQENHTCVGACVTGMADSCSKYLVRESCMGEFPLPKAPTEIQKLRIQKEQSNCREGLK